MTNNSPSGLIALRTICENHSIHTVTLPLLDRFFGPLSYPSLYPFPGCTTPNARQQLQAPGLLDCSALGQEVQACQAAGKRVLLSVKGDGVAAVGGNTGYGDPDVASEPFGPTFGGDGVEKRQIELNGTPEGGDVPPYPIINMTGPPGIPLGPGPVILNATNPGPIPLETATPPASMDEPISILPYPLAYPPLSTPLPNLFTSSQSHTPSAFAETLFSLFGEGHTERADLRPLGPDVPSPASPAPLNGTDWITSVARPLGEEVVIDGFDIQLPSEWKGTYQDKQFHNLVRRLQSLETATWYKSGGVAGGPGDAGGNGKGVVYFGWQGGVLKTRSKGLEVRVKGVVDAGMREGWVEWNGEM
jgi:hypothetical protein